MQSEIREANYESRVLRSVNTPLLATLARVGKTSYTNMLPCAGDNELLLSGHAIV